MTTNITLAYMGLAMFALEYARNSAWHLAALFQICRLVIVEIWAINSLAAGRLINSTNLCSRVEI